MKKTIVLGASPNPARYSYLAVNQLMNEGIEVIPVGYKSGHIAGKEILLGQPAVDDVDTITLYLSPRYQEAYYDYILGLAPRRIIFNPGTENAVLMKMAKENGIEVSVSCTLVMLSVGNY